MSIKELLKRLSQYKVGVAGPWHRFGINFENYYIKVLSIDSSNPPGSYGAENTKQWGIIIDLKHDFSNLPNWVRLVEELGNDIKITRVKSGQYKGNYGIRFYRMATPPNIKIINNFLEVLFE